MQPPENTYFISVSPFPGVGFGVIFGGVVFFFLVKAQEKKSYWHNPGLYYQAADSNLGVLLPWEWGTGAHWQPLSRLQGCPSVRLFGNMFSWMPGISVNRDIATKGDFYSLKKSRFPCSESMHTLSTSFQNTLYSKPLSKAYRSKIIFP